MKKLETGGSKKAQLLNLKYQERIACLTEMMDTLKQKDEYNLSEIFTIVFDALDEMIQHLYGGAIVGIKDNELTFFTTRNINDPDNNWGLLSDGEKDSILKYFHSEDVKDVLFWNYEANAPIIINKNSYEHAIAISFLCQHADDEDLFMIVYRNQKRKPLLSDEIQIIKMVSRILGWHLNYEFTYQLLMYHIDRSFRRQMT